MRHLYEKYLRTIIAFKGVHNLTSGVNSFDAVAPIRTAILF